MSNRSRILDLTATYVSRERLIFTAVGFALTLSVACSARTPQATRDVPTIARSVECIDLTKRGLATASIDSSLVEFAIADSKRVGRSIKLYKVVAEAAGKYYVFDINGWSDIYTVYETDRQGSKFVGKYQYGSLHHPCTVSDRWTQPVAPQRAQ